MWDDQKRGRLAFLRTREAEGNLTASESAELEALFAELDAAEQRELQGGFEQSESRQAELRRQNEDLARQVDQLERIRRDHERLLIEARSYLHQLRKQRAALADEYQRLTGLELAAPP